MNRALADERNKKSDTIPLALPMPSRKDEESNEVPTLLKDMEAKHGALHFYITYLLTQRFIITKL